MVISKKTRVPVKSYGVFPDQRFRTAANRPKRVLPVDGVPNWAQRLHIKLFSDMLMDKRARLAGHVIKTERIDPLLPHIQ